MKAFVDDWFTRIYPTDEEVSRLCRPHKGADTCVWLTWGQDGMECMCLNRPDALSRRWQAGETKAKRDGCEVVNGFHPTGMKGWTEINAPAPPED